MSTGGGEGYRSSINVTPLVDVVLVLLIIFMVIVPLTMRGYEVDVASDSAEVPPPAAGKEQIVLTIDPTDCPLLEPPGVEGLPGECVVSLNAEPVALGNLARRTGEIFADRQGPDRVLFLAVDERLNYEGVIRVVDRARSGVDELRIGFITNEKPALAAMTSFDSPGSRVQGVSPGSDQR